MNEIGTTTISKNEPENWWRKNKPGPKKKQPNDDDDDGVGAKERWDLAREMNEK